MPVTTTNESPTTIQHTLNYDQFSFFDVNRDVNRGHVEAIKAAFEERGNFTAQQPILVNENYQIVDGQHRFTACKEMGIPIYFTVHAGLTAADALAMNIIHREWRLSDYANYHAKGGNTSYRKFLQLAEDYEGFSYSVLMTYAKGEQVPGAFGSFRKGDFVFRDVPGARARLDKLAEAVNITRVKDQDFALAYLKVMAVQGFDQRRMIRKLEQAGEQIIRRFGNVSEYMRAFEEVYNYQMTERNRLRLYW